MSNGFEIEVELVARCLHMGYRVVEVPSYEAIRRHGKGKLKGFQDGAKFLARTFYERLRTLLK